MAGQASPNTRNSSEAVAVDVSGMHRPRCQDGRNDASRPPAKTSADNTRLVSSTTTGGIAGLSGMRGVNAACEPRRQPQRPSGLAVIRWKKVMFLPPNRTLSVPAIAAGPNCHVASPVVPWPPRHSSR